MDDENDLFIRKQLQKDQLISKKADEVFNKFLEEDLKMEQNQQNFQQEQEQNQQFNRKNDSKGKLALKKAFAGIASVAVLLGGANVYATSKGYENVFFMIKYLATGNSEVITDKDEILSDRDITISYDKIALTDKIAVIIKSLQVKDNKATLLLNVITDEESKDYLEYDIFNENDENLCNFVDDIPGISTHDLEIEIPNFKDDDNILKIEIYKMMAENYEKIAKLTINLDERLVEVEGQEEELKKISEIDLKKFLVEEQNKKDIENGTISKTDKLETVIYDVTNLSYCSGIYTATYTYSNVASDYFKTTKEVEELEIHKNTIVFELNENDEFELVSIEEPVVVHVGEEKEEETNKNNKKQDVDAYCQMNISKSIEKAGEIVTYYNDTYLDSITGEKKNIQMMFGNQYGTGTGTFYVPKSKEIVLNVNKVNDGYRFCGWYIDEKEYSQTLEISFKSTQNLKIEARFEKTIQSNEELILKYENGENELNVYEINDLLMRFSMKTSWNNNENSIKTAMLGDDGTYTYEQNGCKITIKLQEGLKATVTEYKNNVEIGKITMEKVDFEEDWIKELTPSGWAGSSNYKVRLYENGDVYVFEYDGAGESDANITKKTLIAKNVTGMVEYYTNNYAIAIYGISIKNGEKHSYNWICYSSAELQEKPLMAE